MGDIPEQITYKCKKCLKDITFPIPSKLIMRRQFPIVLEDKHGAPEHTIRIFINKHFKVDSFEILEELQATEKVDPSSNTRKLLESIGLNDKEIDLYIKCTGKGPMSVGEIAILFGQAGDLKATSKTILKFVNLGLFKTISGSKTHFQALPPYAAIVSQMENFGRMINQLRGAKPEKIMQALDSLEVQPTQSRDIDKFLRELTSVQEQLGKDLKDLNEVIASNLKNQEMRQNISKSINTLQDQSIQLLQDHFTTLVKDFTKIKRKISGNLKKLHLGIIAETISEVVDKSIDSELDQVKEDFKVRFETKFKQLMKEMNDEVTFLTTSADGLGAKMQKTVDDLAGKMKTSFSDAESKLVALSKSLKVIYDDLETDFSEEMSTTLNTLLSKIHSQIVVQTNTIRNFWEESKLVSNFSMKDVWFIQSIEGMQAQISEALSRAKMRITIVSPTLADINPDEIMGLKKHINIRICCSINTDQPEHKEILKKFEKRKNITLRHRSLQNLWAINKDYEEIILGIVNQTDLNGVMMTEIAGIGSVLSEHIKMFVPLLEEAWMNASKNLEGSPLYVKSVIQTASEAIRTPASPLTQAISKSLISAAISSEILPVANASSSLEIIPPKPSAVADGQKSNISPVSIDSPPQTEKIQEEINKIRQDIKIKQSEEESEALIPPKVEKQEEKPRELEVVKVPGPKSERKGDGFSQPVIDPFNKQVQFHQSKKEDENKSKNKMTATDSDSKDSLAMIDEISKMITDTADDSLITKMETLHSIVNGKGTQQIKREIKTWASELRQKPDMDGFRQKMFRKRLESWKEKMG